MNVDFFIPCNPPKATSQASLRVLKRQDGTSFIGKMKGSAAKVASRTLTSLMACHTPPQPLKGPLYLCVTWSYAWRKSEKKKFLTIGKRFCDRRPDLDNLLKLLLDCMTTLRFFDDDAQIASLEVEKSWSDKPGISVFLSELQED